jgi:hypothetical protein
MLISHGTPLNRDQVALCRSARRWRDGQAPSARTDFSSWNAMGEALDAMETAMAARDFDGFGAAFHAYQLAFTTFTAAVAGEVAADPLRPFLITRRAGEHEGAAWDHNAAMYVYALSEEERGISEYGVWTRTVQRLRRSKPFSVYHSPAAPLTTGKVSGVANRIKRALP